MDLHALAVSSHYTYKTPGNSLKGEFPDFSSEQTHPIKELRLNSHNNRLWMRLRENDWTHSGYSRVVFVPEPVAIETSLYSPPIARMKYTPSTLFPHIERGMTYLNIITMITGVITRTYPEHLALELVELETRDNRSEWRRYVLTLSQMMVEYRTFRTFKLMDYRVDPDEVLELFYANAIVNGEMNV